MATTGCPNSFPSAVAKIRGIVSVLLAQEAGPDDEHTAVRIQAELPDMDGERDRPPGGQD